MKFRFWCLFLMMIGLAIQPAQASFVVCSGTPCTPYSTTVSPGGFDAAIRIYDALGNGSTSEGTGTIFDVRRTGDILQFGIVTSAHVVDGNHSGVYLGFRSGSGDLIHPDSLYVASGGGATADIAYIGVSIDLANNPDVTGNATLAGIVANIAPVTIGIAPVNPTQAFAFTSYGYGLSAVANPDNSQPYAYAFDPTANLGFGTERSFSNSVTFYANNFAVTDGGNTYHSDMEGFQLVNDGTGVAEPGDSGSGMFVNGVLQGVIEFAPSHPFTYNGVSGYSGYNYGDVFGGVRLTSSYIGWLQAQDALVITPEPSTFLLAGFLLTGLMRTPKRRK